MNGLGPSSWLPKTMTATRALRCWSMRVKIAVEIERSLTIKEM